MCSKAHNSPAQQMSLLPAMFVSLCLVLWPTQPASGAATPPDIRRDATVIAVEKVMPAVVNIATETIIERNDWYDELLRQFYGLHRPPSRQQSLGSGVIIDEEGYILTNLHVVQRASRIQVKLWDGSEYEADPIVATPDSDVALLKIRAEPGTKFQKIAFSADDDLILGETVIALGNPFGLGGSVSRGILSSKNRRPSTGNEPLNVEDWLQTDAAINPGNSGGPLVNLRGELIGLNVAVFREQHGERGMGVSFSIPVKHVSAALARFFTPEISDGLWLGAQLRSVSGALIITAVQAGSPAARAGLRENDQILRVNDQMVANLLDFNRQITGRTNLETRITVARAQSRSTVTVKLVPFRELIWSKLGIQIQETGRAAARARARAGEGLQIEAIETGSPADRAGLKAGNIIQSIDGQPTSDIRILGAALTAKQKGSSVNLEVIVQRRYANGYVELRQGSARLNVR